MNSVRMVVTGLVLAGLVALVGQSYAENKKLQDGILKLAAAIKGGGSGDAAALAKFAGETDEVMEQMKESKKGGIKVGSIDGIEKTLIKIARDVPTPAAMAKMKGDLEEVGYIIAAIADVSVHKPTAKGAKDKMWSEWSAQMKSGGIDLAKAAKANGAQDVKSAAAKVNATCNACHSKHR